MCALTQNEGAVVGFVSVSGHMDLKLFNKWFELEEFEGLRKENPAHQEEKPEEPQPLGEENNVTDAQQSDEARELVEVSIKTHSAYLMAFIIGIINIF